MNEKDFQRFLNQIIDTGNCWVWIGTFQGPKRNYGCMTIKKKSYRAHRLSFEHYIGPIPSGLGILHSCDNPSCVNPEHLFLGTNKDNYEDAKQKGRSKLGEIIWKKTMT